MTDTTVFTADDKVMIEDETGRHVFRRTDGELEYDREESEPEQFPTSEALARVEEETGDEVADLFPMEFTMYAHDDSNTTHMLRSANLPHDDEELINRFWNYPGEVAIHGLLDRDAGGYDFEPTAIEYEGIRFTPEE